jgi:predicted transcriptional regulator of viral defense system
VCNTFGKSKGFAHMNGKPDYNKLYEMAESQAGYFTASQAREAGFTWERLSTNVKNKKFQRITPGVYRLIHFPASAYEDLFVSWLKAGINSVISHESALAFYDLSDVLPAEVHVTIPRTASRRHRGIRLHTNRLGRGDVTHREGLPVTTPARTIIDTATGHLAEELVIQSVREGIRRGMFDPEDLLEQAKRRKGRAQQVIERILVEEKQN